MWPFGEREAGQAVERDREDSRPDDDPGDSEGAAAARSPALAAARPPAATDASRNRAAALAPPAEAPSEVPQQSNNPRGQAIIGALSACSMVISLRRCALGCLAPLRWLFTEISPIILLPSCGLSLYLAK